MKTLLTMLTFILESFNKILHFLPRGFFLTDKKISNAKCLTKANYFIHETAQLEKIELIEIKDNAEIKDYVIIRTYNNPVKIGANTQINPFTVIYGGSGVYIGDNVMIAPHCTIASGNHNYKQLEKPMRFAGNLTKGPIIIEDDVWIGANCTITDGAIIKKGAVIAANSAVIKIVDEYDIVGGVPAEKIANRKSLATHSTE